MEILIEVDSVTESSGFDNVSQCTYRRKRFVLEQEDPDIRPPEFSVSKQDDSSGSLDTLNGTDI